MVPVLKQVCRTSSTLVLMNELLVAHISFAIEQ
jgi:hypothetical protein